MDEVREAQTEQYHAENRARKELLAKTVGKQHKDV